jgi:hypothetical protein
MTKFLFILAFAVGIALASSAARAQQRLTDGAMGAAAGALVGGPVGLVAGGVIGFTAGPHISHGLFHHGRHYYVRRVYHKAQ